MNPSLSVIIPTFHEADNIKNLIPRLVSVLEEAKTKPSSFEIIVVDDNSQDGIDAVIQGFQAQSMPVSLVVRTADRGLSSAVIHGIRQSANDVCLVMDADFQHPPDVVPRILEPLAGGNVVFVAGRRQQNSQWPLHRRVISALASAMAFPLTGGVCRDPMTGLFAVSRPFLTAHLAKINTHGFKIALEVVVKCGIGKGQCAEVEYPFGVRSAGESKLDQKVIVAYVFQLWDLYCFQLRCWLCMVVGAWLGLWRAIRGVAC